MKPLSPSDLQSMLTTDVDIVDVRDPNEWVTGHVPGARLVPLAMLRVDPRGSLPRDNVVCVCAKGGRSATAAIIAEEIGKHAVYTLGGGTDAWRNAGLPIIMPDRSKAADKTSDDEEQVAEPQLDALVSANLKQERNARGLSLDDLAREAGVSRTLLGQIEIGTTTPSIGIVWKIAQALGVPFSRLLSTGPNTPRVGTTLTHRDKAKKLLGADGRFSSRALYPLGDGHAAEFYELWLAPHSNHDADAHRPGTRENLIVTAGKLELRIGTETVHLNKGDGVNFSADQTHSYINRSSEDCWMYLVMNYAGGQA